MREGMPRTHVRRTTAAKAGSAMLAAVAMLAAAACSNSAKSSSPQGDESAASRVQVAAAQASVDKLLAAPASIGVAEPLKSKPQGGGTIVFLSCENGLCQVLAGAVGEAAKAAGLQFKNKTIKLADPATLISGMRDALQMKPKPVGVVFAGLPQAVWGSQVAAFEKAGIPLIPIAVGETTASPAVPAGSLDGPADAKAQADAIANYVIADSKGTAKALIVNVPDVGSLKIATDEFLSTVRNGCTGCTAGTVDVTLAQVASGGVVPALVSALQRNPGVKYVVTVQGEFTQGFQAAAKAAGLTGLKFVGINPAKFNQQELATGESAAFALLPFHVMGWKAVDVALRYAQGMTVEAGDGPLPLQLLTKETVGAPQDSIDRPEDYQTQFKALWKVR